MARPDAKKNITTLVKAFGENPTLRELANLVLIMVSMRAPAPVHVHTVTGITCITASSRLACLLMALFAQ